MKDDLMKILEAQDVELKIDALERTQKEYPEQIAGLLKEIEDLKQTAADLQTTLKELKAHRGEIESEVLAERDFLGKHEKRLLDTKTNKEYNAVQSEIEQARKRIDSLETEELEIIGKIEELEPRIEEQGKKLEEVAAANTANVGEFRGKLGSIESDRSKLTRERDRILKGLNPRLLSVYQRLRKGRGGIAVVTVDKLKFSCRGCYKHLPHQKVMEIRRGKTMISCENCGRILVWDDREKD